MITFLIPNTNIALIYLFHYVDELRNLIHMYVFYKKFIRNVSSIASPSPPPAIINDLPFLSIQQKEQTIDDR